MEKIRKEILTFLKDAGHQNQAETIHLFMTVQYMEDFVTQKFLRQELINFFEWYKKSPFSSSGKVEDLIDVYLGKPNITATSAAGGQTGT